MVVLDAGAGPDRIRLKDGTRKKDRRKEDKERMEKTKGKSKAPRRLTVLERFMRLAASERLDWTAQVITATDASPAWSKVLVEAGNRGRGERVLAALAANRWHCRELAKQREAAA